MGVRLHSYISFNGTAREALDFYQSVFGGEVYADTYEKYVSTDMPVGQDDMDKIMHGFLKGENGIELMASDTPSNMSFEDGTRITLSLSGDDEELLKGYWNKLGEGGVISVPMATSPWGDTFGMLADKFGVGWMVDIRPASENA